MPEDQPILVTGGSLNVKLKLSPGLPQSQWVEINLPNGGELKSVKIDNQEPIPVNSKSTITIITEVP